MTVRQPIMVNVYPIKKCIEVLFSESKTNNSVLSS